MKLTVFSLLSATLLSGLLAGCVSPNGYPDYTGSGALIGGASGAGLGAMADRGNPGAGALIGGAAGLIAGGLIGHNMDQQAQAARASAPPSAYASSSQAQAPTVSDIESMSRAGVSDDVIINEIKSTHAAYSLDANTIIALKNAGVSQRVINYMINTSSNLTVNQAPPPPPRQIVTVAPGPGYVWIDGDWTWNGGRWFWIRGHWVLPPRPHAIWIAPRWVHEHHRWRRVPGRWR